MAMAARTAMPTEAVLTLAQWFSPAFPVGSFSYSHGLEWAVEAGDVQDRGSLQGWIEDVLRFGAGRNDALFLAASYGAESLEEISEIDATCRAFASSKERLRETELQGAAFCQITADVWEHQSTDLTYPVAAGRATRLCNLPLELTSSMYLHAFAANLVAAGQRLARIGQSEAQAIIRALAPLCTQIADDTQSGDLTKLSSTTFLADIASMKHETQYSRMFRT